jgi:hypothetical protein
MSFISDHLVTGEDIIAVASVHPIVFIRRLFFPIITIPIALTGNPVAIGVASVATIFFVGGVIDFNTREYALTSKRVIKKTGWLQSHVIEAQVAKVESLAVNQTIVGKANDYGFVTASGTGGTHITFDDVRDPWGFRKAIEKQVQESQHLTDSAQQASTQNRDERECPSCAERILAKASRCRFCGHTFQEAA